MKNQTGYTPRNTAPLRIHHTHRVVKDVYIGECQACIVILTQKAMKGEKP